MATGSITADTTAAAVVSGGGSGSSRPRQVVIKTSADVGLDTHEDGDFDFTLEAGEALGWTLVGEETIYAKTASGEATVTYIAS